MKVHTGRTAAQPVPPHSEQSSRGRSLAGLYLSNFFPRVSCELQQAHFHVSLLRQTMITQALPLNSSSELARPRSANAERRIACMLCSFREDTAAAGAALTKVGAAAGRNFLGGSVHGFRIHGLLRLILSRQGSLAVVC